MHKDVGEFYLVDILVQITEAGNKRNFKFDYMFENNVRSIKGKKTTF